MGVSNTNSTAGNSIMCVGTLSPEPRAIQFAEQVSRALGFDLVLLHVPEPGENTEFGEGILDQTRDLLAEAPQRSILEEGDFEETIHQEVDREPYQLVILGTSCRSPEEHLTKRSQRLALDLADSVLVMCDPPEKLRHLLISTGGHPGSIPVEDWGIRLARGSGAEATILHIVTDAPSMYIGLPALEEGLEEILSRETPLAQHLKETVRRADSAGVSVKLSLRHGIVVEEILRACETEHYDLIVIGSHEPGRILDHLAMGRIGPQLLSSVKTSVLIIRTETDTR
ncbi:MAG: universal stress protein [Anaerolineales bacterium]